MPTRKKKPSKSKTPLSDLRNAAGDPQIADRFYIVAMGASAGGLEALNAFFLHMPPDGNMAFVIIQHLSPHHRSSMPSLLKKNTQMPVAQIEDGMKLAPNRIYLNPPDKNVALFNRSLHLMEPIPGRYVNMPIDFFFRSLAEDQADKAIGIVLSGTASDGTLGLKAIKAQGGMAMVQDPESAKYDGMPTSAIATGLVDFILPVEQMPQTLTSFIRHPALTKEDKGRPGDSHQKNQLQKVFVQIRAVTGHDFSHYKQTTIRRRIDRRLAVHQIDKLSDYVQYIQKNPAEIDLLFKNLVIGVTHFFRDPKAFEVIEKKALPDLVRHKKREMPLRIWVVGCSTGEEAYSLAILVAEQMDKLNKHLNVQIFATDIDETAIEVARKGVYPEGICTDIAAGRLRRFFIKDPQTNGYKVKKQIRDMVVFSPQSVIKDPPFSRLDLVSCRNLMIYMDNTLQKKILPLFHYTLNAEGILFLGTSESIGNYTDYFKPLDSRLKVFKRPAGLPERLADYPMLSVYGGPVAPDAGERVGLPATVSILAATEKALLETYSPAGALIDGNNDILHFVGDTEAYLVPPKGKPNFNLLNMARNEIKYQLTTAIRKAVRQNKNITQEKVHFDSKEGRGLVNIRVTHLSDKGLPPGLLLVMFENQLQARETGEALDVTPQDDVDDTRVNQLEQELKSTREYLQSAIEEQETTNEELKSTNEEMQSVNEELQSSNEELETSKEELQSTNEELSTVNSELQIKVDELSRASDDMENLMRASQIASIFLDTALCIKRFTPKAAEMIKLIQTDVGRSLSDLRTSFPSIDLVEQARHVLNDLNTLSLEVLSDRQIWHTIQINPYRTVNNIIDGVVMTFIDIHEVKQAAKVRRLATVLQDANDAVTVQDFDGRILAWNKGAVAMYGWTEAEALQMSIRDLVPENQYIEERKIIKMVRQGKFVKAFKSQRRCKDGKLLEIWLTATTLNDETGHPVEVATTERDLAWLAES